MNNERIEFSRRLAAAMRAMGEEARPSVLLARFNARYDGPPVSFQTASSWLKGKILPEQDKLVVLAQLFRIHPQTLRYGGKDLLQGGVPRFMWPDRVPPRERTMFENFLALPPKQREAIRALIESLAQAGTERG